MAPLVTWLGQAGFLLEAGGRRILIDPFFDAGYEGRAYPPPPLDVHGARCDWLLVTHEHVDHLDPVSLAAIVARSPGITVVAPEPLRGQVERLSPGVAFIGARPGDALALPGAGSLQVVPAIHGVEVGDGYSAGDGRFVGYVLELDGVALYHAGDTIVTDAVREALAGVRVDVALLPVNGRTYFRERAGLVGNMGVRDAVALAAEIGAATLVPIHWDLFAANSERPGAAADEAWATDAPVHVLALRRELPWVAAPAPRPAAP